MGSVDNEGHSPAGGAVKVSAGIWHIQGMVLIQFLSSPAVAEVQLLHHSLFEPPCFWCSPGVRLEPRRMRMAGKERAAPTWGCVTRLGIPEGWHCPSPSFLLEPESREHSKL